MATSLGFAEGAQLMRADSAQLWEVERARVEDVLAIVEHQREINERKLVLVGRQLDEPDKIDEPDKFKPEQLDAKLEVKEMEESKGKVEEEKEKPFGLARISLYAAAVCALLLLGAVVCGCKHKLSSENSDDVLGEPRVTSINGRLVASPAAALEPERL